MIEVVGDRDFVHYHFIMPKLSIAVIVFAVLALLFVRLFASLRDNHEARPLLALIALAAFQTVLVSLRWDHGVLAVRPLQIFFSCLLPALAWVSFRGFSSQSKTTWKWRDGLHILPAVLCGIAYFAFPALIDLIIISTFSGYGIALLRLTQTGESNFSRAPLDAMIDLRRALWLVTFTLFGSAITDLLVALDFWRGGGVNAPVLVGMGNLASLAAIAVAATLGSRSIPEVEAAEEPAHANEETSEDAAAIVEAATKLLREGALAKDPNLTLGRLARRMALPARSVSRAINQVRKQNVSQFVNDIRIEEACRLLQNKDINITEATYDCGFQTKSNFNREFLRVTGMTPRDWRNSNS